MTYQGFEAWSGMLAGCCGPQLVSAPNDPLEQAVLDHSLIEGSSLQLIMALSAILLFD